MIIENRGWIERDGLFVDESEVRLGSGLWQVSEMVSLTDQYCPDGHQ